MENNTEFHIQKIVRLLLLESTLVQFNRPF